jgi:hypothetical protein
MDEVEIENGLYCCRVARGRVLISVVRTETNERKLRCSRLVPFVNERNVLHHTGRVLTMHDYNTTYIFPPH